MYMLLHESHSGAVRSRFSREGPSPFCTDALDALGPDLQLQVAAAGGHPHRRCELERKALMAHARECKARKAMRRTRGQHADTMLQRCSRCGGASASEQSKWCVGGPASGAACYNWYEQGQITRQAVAVAELSYTGGTNGTLARAWNISKSWIAVLRRFTACAYLELQCKSLSKLVQAAASQQPLFCMSRLAYDETGERLTTKDAHQTSVWQVMIARMEVCVGWWDGHQCNAVTCDIVLPTALVASANAENIYRTLFGHASYMPFRVSPDAGGSAAPVASLACCL